MNNALRTEKGLAVIDHLSPAEPVRAAGISMGTGTILNALTQAPRRFAGVMLGAPLPRGKPGRRSAPSTSSSRSASSR